MLWLAKILGEPSVGSMENYQKNMEIIRGPGEERRRRTPSFVNID